MKSDFLTTLFIHLNEHYRYVVLRNWEGLPGECRSRDIDLLMTRSELRHLRGELAGIASASGCSVLYENWDNQFWTVVYTDEEADVFQLDFQHNFAWMGIDLLSEKEVLEHRRFNGRVWHLDPVYTFLPKYLYSRILGASYPEKYRDVREAALSEGREEVERVLRELSLGRGGLSYWDKAGKWSLRMRCHLATLWRRPFRAIWRMQCFLWIYLWQLLSRRGWMISGYVWWMNFYFRTPTSWRLSSWA